MLGVAIFTAPIQWMFGNAVLTYNVAYIGSYVLAGFGMFLLTRAPLGARRCRGAGRARLCADSRIGWRSPTTCRS